MNDFKKTQASLIKEINEYFSPLTFQRYQSFEKYATYVCRVNTYESSSRNKYVVVSVLNKDAFLEKATIDKLRWFNIMTSDEIDIKIATPLFDFFHSHKDNNVSTKKVFIADNRNYEKTTYSNTKGDPIKIILLHNSKKKSYLQWPDELTLHQAVDTYKCIIYRTDF